MKKPGFLLAFFCLFVLSSPLLAINTNTTTGWQEGVIILDNNDVLKGDINYDYKHDLVMYRHEGKIQTFTAFQLHSFLYYDSDEDIFHRFITVDHQPRPFHKITSIFEVVLKGDVQYLRKHNQYPPRTITKTGLSLKQNYVEQITCYDYFVYYQDELVKSKRFKKELLPALEKEDQTLADFIKDNRLRPYQISDQIRLIEYYNGMQSKDILNASL